MVGTWARVHLLPEESIVQFIVNQGGGGTGETGGGRGEGGSLRRFSVQTLHWVVNQ